jgi:hypothetical protein
MTDDYYHYKYLKYRSKYQELLRGGGVAEMRARFEASEPKEKTDAEIFDEKRDEIKSFIKPFRAQFFLQCDASDRVKNKLSFVTDYLKRLGVRKPDDPAIQKRLCQIYAER